MKDWSGNSKSLFVCNGASNHSRDIRQSDDFYATDPIAIHKLCEVENFSNEILEPAAGAGHMVNALIEHGYKVFASDIVDRVGGGYLVADFFRFKHLSIDIITNPPYKYAKEFVEHALDIVDDGNKVAMFPKLTFLESKSRRTLFEKYPPKRIWVFRERVRCAKNGDFQQSRNSTAVSYAWFVWEKGFKGNPIIHWI